MAERGDPFKVIALRRGVVALISFLAVRHPLAVLLVAAVLAALGAWLGLTRVVLDADTNNLIASDRPFMRRYRSFLEEFGDLEYIYVAVQDRADPPDPAAAKACVDDLVNRLRDIRELPGLSGWISPEEQRRIAVRAMPEDELRGLAMAGAGVGRLAEGTDGRTAVATANRLLTRAAALAGPTRAERERDGAAGVLLLRSAAAGAAGTATASEMRSLRDDGLQREYLVSSSGRMYFVQILPVKDYGTLTAIEGPLERIRAVIDEVRPRHPTVEIGLTGKPVLQADELRSTQQDMMRSTAGGFLLVSVLFMFFAHGVRRPLFAAIAFLMAFGWTYGFAALAVGRLNLLSMVFMLVLVGVGLDYGVILLGRYMELRRGRSTPDAVRLTIDVTLPGNFTGATTSAAVFFAALLTDFQGLRELGLIAGVGLLLCMIAMSVVLPALLVQAAILRKHAPVRLPPATGDRFPRWLRLPARHPWATLLVLFATSAALVSAPGKVRFENNLLKLQAEGLDSVDWEHRILEDSVSASWFGAIVEPDMAAIPPVVAAARSKPEVGRVLSVLDLVRPDTPERTALREALQTASNEPVEAQAPGAATLERLVSEAAQRLESLANAAKQEAPKEAASLVELAGDLRTLAHRLTEDPAAATAQVDAAVTEIGRSFREMLNGDRLELRTALPEALRAQLVSPGGLYLVSIYPSQDIWELEPMRAFIDALVAIDPRATGVPFTVYESASEMRASFRFMALASLVAVAVLVFLDFRSVSDLFMALVVLGIGMLWTFEVMGLFDVSLNLANFFGVPILLGIAVDSSVHLLHRYHQGGPDRIWPVETRRAVMMTSVVTTIGFGSLVFAHHRGLQSLGWIMIIGNLACLAGSLLVLPALLKVFERWRGEPVGHREMTNGGGAR
ncbi:MAG: MMPL family transporter [Phycisphaerales bacterium]|nr:MMPL family transporter [Phycisphaerales bacterium]